MSEPETTWTCASCRMEFTDAELAETGGVCPNCAAPIGPHTPPSETSAHEHAVTDELEGLELDLIRRIRAIPQENSWQAPVVAEILNDFVAELVEFMDGLPVVATGSRWFARRRRLTARIDDAFEGFLMALLGCEDVLRKELGMALAGGELAEIRIFYEQFSDEMHQLKRFYGQTAALVFPAKSLHRELQATMLTWGPYIAHQLMDLANRLRRVGGQSPKLTRAFPTQVTLVPVTLPLFYNIHAKVI